MKTSLNNWQTTEMYVLRDLFADRKHEIRLVGGAVRDMLMGVDPHDFDFATTATPEEMKWAQWDGSKKYRGHTVTAIPTGLDHGTITWIIDGKPFEVTTLRKDKTTDGRHAVVEFTDDWIEDAARRDFTCNAMSVDFGGTLYDYFRGQIDLKEGSIIFVGDYKKRLEEDHLRILRYFRFCTKINTEFTTGIARFKQHQYDQLQKISVERIWDEFKKILKTATAGGTMPYVGSRLPKELRIALDLPSGRTFFEKNSKAFNLENDIIQTFVYYFLATVDDAIRISEVWKMSNNEKERMIFYAENQFIDCFEAEELLINGYPIDWVCNVLNPSLSKQAFIDWEIPVMPVRGGDIVEAGITPGPLVGKILRELKDAWVQSRYRLTRDELMEKIWI
tara:strand:- start:1265 stop:2437 length:1173 start_codon:yes stop_codon:yes gene_type:complete